MNIDVIVVDTNDLEHKTIFQTLFDEYMSSNSKSLERDIASQLFSLAYFHGFICFVDNKPAGFAVCYESFSSYRAKPVLNIHDFMVSQAYRGRGIGKRLLNGIEQYCSDNDYVKMTLEVDSDNSPAKKLYASCGYEDYQVVQAGQLHWQKYLQ